MYLNVQLYIGGAIAPIFVIKIPCECRFGRTLPSSYFFCPIVQNTFQISSQYDHTFSCGCFLCRVLYYIKREGTDNGGKRLAVRCLYSFQNELHICFCSEQANATVVLDLGFTDLRLTCSQPMFIHSLRSLSPLVLIVVDIA